MGEFPPTGGRLVSVKSVSRIGVVVATMAATVSMASPSAFATLPQPTVKVTPTAAGPFTVGDKIEARTDVGSSVDSPNEHPATLVMRLFKNGTCSGAAFGTGAPATIPPGGTNAAGVTFSLSNADAATYSWQATLDQYTDPDIVVCSSAVVVNQHSPNMAVGGSNAALGNPVHAQAVLSNRSKTPVDPPPVSMSFSLYPPSDAACSENPVFVKVTKVVTNENTYDSGTFTPAAAGTYRWKITYTGDGNNAPVTASCGVAKSIVTSGGTPPPTTKTPTCEGAPATILGTGKGETILGTPGNDVIVAKGGKDVVNGRGGNDLICGGGGDDILRGGGGDDVIHGNDGNDDVQGGQGSDELFGDRGSDRIVGGPGNDKLRGGAGNDGLDGGKGTDKGDGGPGTDVARSIERTG
jgi:Ca2+-binding RTX toxin-like protein